MFHNQISLAIVLLLLEFGECKRNEWNQLLSRAARANGLTNSKDKDNLQPYYRINDRPFVTMDLDGSDMKLSKNVARDVDKQATCIDKKSCSSRNSMLPANPSKELDVAKPSFGSPPDAMAITTPPSPAVLTPTAPDQKADRVHELQTLIQQLYVAQAQVQLEATEIQQAQTVAAAAQQALEEASNNVRVLTAALHAAQQTVAGCALRAQTAQLQLAAHDQLLFTARQRVDALSAQMVGLQAEQGIGDNKMAVDLPSLLAKLNEPLPDSQKPTAIPSILGSNSGASSDPAGNNVMKSGSASVENFDDGGYLEYGINSLDENSEDVINDGILMQDNGEIEKVSNDVVRNSKFQNWIEAIAKSENEKFIDEFLNSVKNGHEQKQLTADKLDIVRSTKVRPEMSDQMLNLENRHSRC